MTEERSGLVAAELGGLIYAIGGPDGISLLISVEVYESDKKA